MVGIDLIYVKNLTGVQSSGPTASAGGSNFQLVMPFGDENQKSGANVWKCLVECWLRFLGHLEILAVDLGTEFQGDFAEACGANNITLLPIDPKAPWQNGRTERAGHEWKWQFKHPIRKGVPTEDSIAEIGIATWQTSA